MCAEGGLRTWESGNEPWRSENNLGISTKSGGRPEEALFSHVQSARPDEWFRGCGRAVGRGSDHLPGVVASGWRRPGVPLGSLNRSRTGIRPISVKGRTPRGARSGALLLLGSRVRPVGAGRGGT